MFWYILFTGFAIGVILTLQVNKFFNNKSSKEKTIKCKSYNFPIK